MSECTSRSCAQRQGMCPVSLLCGCGCHALAAVSTAPSGQVDQGGEVVDPDVFQYRDKFGHIVTSNSPQPQTEEPDEAEDEDEDEDEDEELTAREMAELLMAGALAANMSLFPNQPVRVAQNLIGMLERNGLRIVTS